MSTSLWRWQLGASGNRLLTFRLTALKPCRGKPPFGGERRFSVMETKFPRRSNNKRGGLWDSDGVWSRAQGRYAHTASQTGQQVPDHADRLLHAEWRSDPPEIKPCSSHEIYHEPFVPLFEVDPSRSCKNKPFRSSTDFYATDKPWR